MFVEKRRRRCNFKMLLSLAFELWNEECVSNCDTMVYHAAFYGCCTMKNFRKYEFPQSLDKNIFL